MKKLKAPRFVKIKKPIPGEEGTLMLLSSDHAIGEYRIGLRDGAVRSYSRDEIDDIHFRETLRRKLKSLRYQITQPIVPLVLFTVWMFTIFRYYGWKPGVLALLAATAAIVWDRCRR